MVLAHGPILHPRNRALCQDVNPWIDSEQTAKTCVAEEIAKTYGLDSFRQIEAIRYTWKKAGPVLISTNHHAETRCEFLFRMRRLE